MVKKFFLTVVAAGLLIGTTAIIQPSPAEACGGCGKLAKATYPHNRAMRKAYRKACKAAFIHWWPRYWARHHRY
jgi:hypothetical protein